ncbi:hypothetical protein Tco_1137251 [Tanacetum coccineum]
MDGDLAAKSSQVQTQSKTKFRSLFNTKQVKDSDCVLPLANLQAIKHKFENTLVGYFVGKSVAFTPVKNYVTNTWMNQVLEQGPWIIRNTPIILNKWSPDLSLCKDKVTSVPVWVKLHKVPIVAYMEDCLSLIASQIGKPVMLDTFTCAICNNLWGRIGFVRALIEVNATKDLKKEVIMAVPNEDGTEHAKVNIQAEYEWKPPLCLECHVFGHTLVQCPNNVKEPATVNEEAQTYGFTTVSNRKRKGKKQSNTNLHGGIKLQRPKTFEYRPVATPTAEKHIKQIVSASTKEKHVKQVESGPVVTTNHFEALNDDVVRLVDEGETSGKNKEDGLASANEDTQDDSDNEVEETYAVETLNLKGASTPSVDVLNV